MVDCAIQDNRGFPCCSFQRCDVVEVAINDVYVLEVIAGNFRARGFKCSHDANDCVCWIVRQRLEVLVSDASRCADYDP